MSNHIKYIAVVFIFLSGVLLRLHLYWANRSLIIDEANLARNVVDKNYTQLFQSLDYDQYAPPLFLAISKISISLFGVHEFALRLFPLIAGITTIFFLFLILRRTISNSYIQWYGLLLFSFSALAIRYSSEFKQYSSDAFMATILIWLAIHWKDRFMSKKVILIWVLFGWLAIWLSMPSVFILAGIGLAFLYKGYLENKNVIKWIMISGSWLLSFAVYFYMILYQDTLKDQIQIFHNDYFLNILTIDAWRNNFKLLESIIRSALDKSLVSIVWGTLIFILGCLYLIRKEKFLALVFIAPIIFCLVASQFHLYSLIDRMTLFLIPSILIIICYGVNYIWNFKNKYNHSLVVLLMVFTVINKKPYEYIFNPLELENSKALMSYLEVNKANNELIYVQHDGVPAFIFYNELHKNAYHFENYYLANWQDDLEQIIPAQQQNIEPFWLFFSHTYPQSFVDSYLVKARKIKDQAAHLQVEQASVYYFK